VIRLQKSQELQTAGLRTSESKRHRGIYDCNTVFNFDFAIELSGDFRNTKSTASEDTRLRTSLLTEIGLRNDRTPQKRQFFEQHSGVSARFGISRNITTPAWASMQRF
jgi:hypothetical protein